MTEVLLLPPHCPIRPRLVDIGVVKATHQLRPLRLFHPVYFDLVRADGNRIARVRGRCMLRVFTHDYGFHTKAFAVL